MKRLFLLTIFFFILTSASAQRVFLISVGYNGSNLRYAEKDAKDVCRVFKIKSVDSLKYGLYTGSEATVSSVTAALSECEKIARPEDTFVFFFSGHCGMKFYTLVAPLPDRNHLNPHTYLYPKNEIQTCSSLHVY